MTAQDADLQIYLGGVWTDVPLYSAAGTTITRGQQPDGSWPRPASIECEINNDSLNYDPARPESAIYGRAGRNTPTRIIVNGSVRLWAEASSWKPERTQEHAPGANKGRSWTSLRAEGLLRRIGMWTDPLRSPMFRTISTRSTCIGHWSLEDGRDSTILSNSSGGPSGTFNGITFEETNSPLGAEQSVKTSATSLMSGRFDSASTTAGWQVAFSFRLAALPGSATYGSIFRWTTSNGYTWLVEVNNTTFRWSVTDSAGASVYVSGGIAFGTNVDPTQWLTMRVRVVQSGGNVDCQPSWYVQGATVDWGVTLIFPGTIGALRQWWQDGGTVVADAHFSHIFGVTTVADDLLSYSVAIPSFNGYKGETAYDRFFRLCSEVGVAGYLTGGGIGSDTQRMGPQRADTFLSLVKGIRETDDCKIEDSQGAIGLTLRTRRAMYNQTPALTLSYPSQVAVPFQRILDDQATHNRVTVQNATGGEVTSQLLAGSMSVQPPPSGVGEYKFTIDVNVESAATQLQDIADWHLAKGTLERPRYEEVTVDLLANPSLATAAVAVREGNMIAITGAEPETVYLLVDGIVERIGKSEWTITYQTELYDPYILGVYDDGTWRWDTRTTTLAAGATSTGTSLSLTTSSKDDVLTTAAGSLPYDLMVAGERVRVTAITAAAGSGPYTQTATVTRSVNGVVKAQLAGSQVNVYDSRRWGL